MLTSAESRAVHDAAGVNCEMIAFGFKREDVIQLSIATSLKRIADLLESVIDIHTYPMASICTREGLDRG